MFRTMLLLAFAALVGTTAGCRMCASPYDECGPVYSDGCGGSCDPNYRAGSILAGYHVASVDEGTVLPSSPLAEAPLDLPEGAIIVDDQMAPVEVPTQAPSVPSPTITAPPIPGPAIQ